MVAGRVALAVAWFQLLLIAPNHPHALTGRALWLLPLELPAILVLMVAAPRRTRPLLAWILGVLMAGVMFTKVADLSANAALARDFNWLLDAHLIVAAFSFLKGVIGLPGAGAAGLAAVAVLAGVAWITRRASGALAEAVPALGRRRALALALLVTAGYGAVAGQRWVQPSVYPPVEAFTAKLALAHVREVRRSWDDLARFRRAAATDPLATVPSDRLFADLGRRDVLLTFVESYGRSAVTDPRYRSRTRAALEGLRAAARSRGLGIRSAWLEAPTVGGQSWLSHASMLSGLWIDTQQRYEALLQSDRLALTHLFGRAGWRRVAAMPAITRAWPDGAYYDYDRLYDEAGLDYAGEPFNWVTMPDQYTLATLSRRELNAPRRIPVFAEIAMISSHAPWTPIPPVLPWDRIDGGAVFDRWATGGDPPAEVWADPQRVRRQYGKAIRYVLDTLAAFVADKLPRGAVLIVLGDHQPAPVVTGPDATRQVPVHIVAPPAVLARLDRWGWTRGARPSGDAPVWRMDALRDRLVAAFTPGVTP